MVSTFFPTPRRRVGWLAATAAMALCTLGGCTVGPNFEKPQWAAPGSWFSGPREPVMKASAHACVSTPEPATIDVDWWY